MKSKTSWLSPEETANLYDAGFQDPITQSFVAVALALSEDDCCLDNLPQSTKSAAISDCAQFLNENRISIGDRLAEAGGDFLLTRNGHGAGFFDGDWANGDQLTEAANRYGEFDLYRGDDGLVYAFGREEARQ
ncbi:MAG: hypothetical protein P4L33_02665 [Capsulimonadaceae bacterium]|nr:hypothetical protein [Capsulimonadaceae bacterium]